MPTLHFLGRVLPYDLNVSVPNHPPLGWEAPEVGLSMQFVVHIQNSNIDVQCDVNRYDAHDIRELQMRSFDLCCASVNLVAFATGRGLTVRLDEVRLPDGANRSIHIENPRLADLCTAFDMGNGFGAVLKIVLQKIPVILIMNDLISSMSNTNVASVSCARALDGIKNQISPGIKDDARSWKRMQQALNVTEPYLKFVTSHSRDARHARLIGISETAVDEIIVRSWTVMDRYLWYLIGGEESLPHTKYPTLTG